MTVLIKSLLFLGLISGCKNPPPSPLPLESKGPVEKKEFICHKEGRPCWEFPSCRAFCEDLFFNKEDRKICHKWPIDLLDSFKTLFWTIGTQSFDNINPRALHCFVKVSNENRKLVFKRLNKEEAVELLEEMAQNSSLSYHIARADKGDFVIMDNLFKKAGRNLRSMNSLAKNMNQILLLIHEQENKAGWDLFNSYIIYRCKKNSHCDEPLEQYCVTFKDSSSKTLEDFFENPFFEKAYKREIKSKTCGTSYCEYGDVKDFKALCKNI